MAAQDPNIEQQQQQLKVAVVGGGIVGIASALRIKEALPLADVTIFTEKMSPNTTGDVAAGFWTPIYLSDTPPSLSDPWAEDTYKFLVTVLRQDPRPEVTGVFYCPGYELYKTDEPPLITWSHVPIGFRRMSSSELQMFPSKYRSGYYYVTVMAEGRKFIPYLMNKFFSQGGHLVVNERVTSLTSLHRRGFDRVVNCCGLGARELSNDSKVVPIRGQVLRIDAPWMNFWFADDEGTYCLPNTDTVVVGGVSQTGNWSLDVSQSDREDILRRVCTLWPQLRSAKVIGDAVGLRPGRECVRVERERTESGKVIYHNYGHGGSGLTLFWGCAADVARMLREDFVTEQAKL